MAKAQPCVVCGGEKAKIRGARYCEVCRESSVKAVAARAADAKSEKRNAATNQRRLAEGRPLRMSKAKTPEGMKWCGRCERFLPIDKFAKRSNGSIAPYCPPCQKSYNHGRHILVKFGISVDEYLSLLEVQGGRCAICQCRPRKFMLAVDHDHETGEVRGLLCSRCNRYLLGSAHDSISILQRAVDYMTNPTALQTELLGSRILEQRAQFEAQLDAALDDSTVQQRNAGTPFGVAFIRRPGGRWFAALTIEQFCELYREATS